MSPSFLLIYAQSPTALRLARGEPEPEAVWPWYEPDRYPTIEDARDRLSDSFVVVQADLTGEKDDEGRGLWRFSLPPKG